MHGMNAVSHFGSRLDKIFRDLDCDLINDATMDPYDKNPPIQLSVP